MEYSLPKFCEKVTSLTSEKIPFASVTIVGIRGEAPQNLGAKMLVGMDGILFGTIGGGKVENRCIEHTREILNSSKNIKNEIVKWNLQKDIGMTCGGEVTFLFEYEGLASSFNIAIFGAGHVAQELVKVLSLIDCRITIIDPRKDWVDKIDCDIEKIVSENPSSLVDELPENTFVLSITKGHSTDVPILEKALERNFPYVGVIGSNIKGMTIKKELGDLGVPIDKIERLICPIGLPIGNNSPGQIAISIAAQLLQVRDKF